MMNDGAIGFWLDNQIHAEKQRVLLGHDDLGLVERQAELVEERPQTVSYPMNEAVPIQSPGPREARHYQASPVWPTVPLIEASAELVLSTHFVAADFAPSDESYLYVRVHPLLVSKLEELTDRLEENQIVVLAGYCPPLLNQINGGCPRSAHLNGLAADILCPGVPIRRLGELAQEIFAGLGRVELFQRVGYVHVDITLAAGGF